MATRRYSINKQDFHYQVTEAVGAAVATREVEVTVDLATVGDAAGKETVLLALKKIETYILEHNWPPA